jgi:hypothetical protein
MHSAIDGKTATASFDQRRSTFPNIADNGMSDSLRRFDGGTGGRIGRPCARGGTQGCQQTEILPMVFWRQRSLYGCALHGRATTALCAALSLHSLSRTSAVAEAGALQAAHK